LAVQAHQKGLDVEYQIKIGVESVLGDSGRLRQILMNLVGNAIKFTHAGEIFVQVDGQALSEYELELQFSVADTGIGIPVDKQQVIFEAFSQADGSTTRMYGGTGLGLTISAQLVNLMGGRIWVESAVNKGSTFYFTVRMKCNQLFSTSNNHFKFVHRIWYAPG
jgi:signal transduction histidine kinase